MGRQASFTLSIVLILFCSGCNDYAANIERVLAADRAAETNATSINHVLSRMRSIDLKGCPTDFSDAYAEHIQAWQLLASVELEAKALNDEYTSMGAYAESFLRGAFGVLTLGAVDPFALQKELNAAERKLRSNHDHAKQQILLTFEKLEKIARSHGAQVKSRW